MNDFFDEQDLPIPCEHCGHEMSVTVAMLKTSPTLTCDKCGTATRVDASQFSLGIAEAEHSIGQLERKIDLFGK